MEKKILKNGIKYLIIPNNNKSIVSIKFIFLCGFHNEFSGINNFTHLLEHLIAYYFNKKQCSVKKIKKILSNKTFESNAYTFNEFMCIFIKCYQKDLEFFMKLLSRTIYDLCITEENLNMSKQNVIKELNQIENYHLDNCINKYIFNRDKTSITDCINDVMNCNIDNITTFYNNIFSKKMIIGICCHKKNINKNKKNIIKLFDKKIKVKNNIYPINFNTQILKNNKIYKIYKPVSSVEINMVYPFNIKKYTQKYWELVIVLNYLFDFTKGPLYNELRNKEKIIYNINYDLEICYQDTNKTLLIVNSNCDIHKLNKFFIIFNKIFKNFKIEDNMFFKSKQLLLFQTQYDYMTNYDGLLDYNLYNYVYDMNISYKQHLNNLKNARINKKIIKEFKNIKCYTFLFNKTYTKKIKK